MTDADFVNWIESELTKKGWSRATLARRMGVSSSQVSHVLNKRSPAGEKFCLGIAAAFQMLPEEVLEKAGLVEIRQENHPVNNLMRIARRLNGEQLHALTEIARQMLK